MVLSNDFLRENLSTVEYCLHEKVVEAERIGV
jgi:hypothetical protein